jgi:hypothetical protein
MAETRVLGILIEDRLAEAVEVQRLLTEYGCSIKTRLGLHEADDTKCSRAGLVLLELCGRTEEWDALESKLAALKGVKVRKMSF